MSAPLQPIVTAAGVAFIAGKSGVPILNRLVLFVQRSGTGDHGGEWCFPGGGIEEGETAWAAAQRECSEEIGVRPKGDKYLLARTRKVYEVAAPTAADGTAGAAPPLSPAVPLGPIVDYTTFAQKIEEPFDVKLNEEHTAYTWAPAGRPPQPLHPGAEISLARLTMDELDIAEAMARGDLMSPQYHHNMAMFDMRITGTGIAYRRGIKEYVFRKPEHYLTERFLKRANGLNVILEHPEKATLDSKEFGDRIVGNVFLPYIKGDEVWGIAKIYDDTTIRMLETGQLSTSPSVVFRDPSTTNQKIALDGGEKVLVEGDPNLVDHLAICPKGVWDKGGEPRGIEFETRKDDDMNPEEQAAADKAKKDAETAALQDKAKKDAEEKEAKEKADAEKAKADADAGVKLDKLLTCVDSLATRMDAFDARDKAKADAEAEEKRKAGDPEQVAADKAKKDAEMEAADKAKKDAEYQEKADRAKADAETRDSIQKLADAIPKVMSDDELNAMADAQSRADSVFTAFGRSAPRPLPGESLLQYRRRNAAALKVHSPAYKDADLSAFADDVNGNKLFEAAETIIYNDASAAANSPADVPADQLMENRRPDVTGRMVSTFRGQPRAWLDGFSSHRRRLTGIRNR